MRRRRTAAKLALALAAALAVLIAAPPAVGAEEDEQALEENWHALYLNAGKAGYQHERVTERESEGGPVYQTELHQEFAVARGEVEMRFVVATTVREDAEGRVVAFRHRIEGPLSMVVQGRAEGDEMLIRTGTGRAAQNSRVPRPEGLCYWALRRFQREKDYEPGTSYTVPVFLPESPNRPAQVSVTVVGKEEVPIFEVAKRLNRVDSVISIMPGVKSSEWVDDEGTVWLARMQIGGGLTLESRKVTQELALAPDDPSDILAASIVPTDRPIASARQLGRLTMLLVPATEEVALPDIASDAHQAIERVEEGMRVTIRKADASAVMSYVLPYGGEEHAALTGPTVWLETGDEVLAAMAQEAVGDETDAVAASRRIEQYVRGAISDKNLSLGFATAAEAARQKAGDCTEHAVLCAALARAVGMPSRVVGGLVYARDLFGVEGGGFGYHMWAEVYAGEWLPIDAALGGHDATHLALVRSDLDEPDDLLDVSSAISEAFGAFRVEVLETAQ
jgi:hypothetical protein